MILRWLKSIFIWTTRCSRLLTEAPFAIPWETRPGKFTLRVIATDQAGNTAETAATFTVQR